MLDFKIFCKGEELKEKIEEKKIINILHKHMKKDIHQKRYTKHQSKKKRQLIEILESRVSQRIFNNDPITDEEIKKITHYMAQVPNSCSRQAIYAIVIDDRVSKELLGGLLVGGVGWIHRADKVLLLFAFGDAYKAAGEIKFMPYLDAGAVLMSCYLICEEMNIGTCFVNPNIREEYKKYFSEKFNKGGLIFCGALALGKYDKKAGKNIKKNSILIK